MRRGERARSSKRPAERFAIRHPVSTLTTLEYLKSRDTLNAIILTLLCLNITNIYTYLYLLLLGLVLGLVRRKQPNPQCISQTIENFHLAQSCQNMARFEHGSI